MPKERLDTLLVQLGHFPSREQAQRAILAGWVKVNDAPVTKAGQSVATDDKIDIEQKAKFVSRGGLKLEKALAEFGVDPKDRVVLDVGASTGGFTDCLLKAGAKQVIAVDVGYGQLAWELRNDPRVVVMERTNIRHVTPDQLPEQLPDLAVIDTSFISLDKVLPAVFNLLTEPKEVVALVKPQFEAGKGKVGKGGVVREAGTHLEVLERVAQVAQSIGWSVLGSTYSPVLGPSGNIEFLIHLAMREGTSIDYKRLVERAHTDLR